MTRAIAEMCLAGSLSFNMWAFQTIPVGVPEFEVASVRARPVALVFNEEAAARFREILQSSNEGFRLQSGELHPNPLVPLRSVTLRSLIKLAYKEILHDDYLVGGPAWLDSELVDVIAKAPEGASADEKLLMIQSLLAERFHLAVHREQKTMTVLGLVPDKHGTKLIPSASEGDPGCKVDGLPPPARRLTCHSVTMAFLANTLTLRLKAGPIVDVTGLAGPYDLALQWQAGRNTADTPNGFMAPLLEALDKQLGLKAESRKESMPVVVIDHVDRAPTGD